MNIYIEETGQSIDKLRLTQLKCMCVLEAKGMRHSSGRTACQRGRELLGLPRNTTREEVARRMTLLNDHINEQIALGA